MRGQGLALAVIARALGISRSWAHGLLREPPPALSKRDREAHYVRIIESLEFTIGWPTEDIRALERFRRQRHRAWYERAYTTSDAEADEMLSLAERLRADVESGLRAHHPGLAPPGQQD